MLGNLRNILLSVVLILPFSLHAQKYGEKLIGKALLEVIYERTKVTDTLDIENDNRKEIFNLKISKNGSGFYSDALRIEDSLNYYIQDYGWLFFKDKEHQAKILALPHDYLYKNFPEGKVTVHDRFDGCHWEYEEDWVKPEWNIIDSVSNFLGYDCILAEADFRGRKWYAWFTPEIPIQDGPWKLCGLPGLILYAHDSKNHYSYIAKQINNEDIGNVVYFKYHEIFKTKRHRFLIDKWKAIHESLGYKILSSGAFGLKPRPGLTKPDKIPHSNYDPEETDFPHQKE